MLGKDFYEKVGPIFTECIHDEKDKDNEKMVLKLKN